MGAIFYLLLFLIFIIRPTPYGLMLLFSKGDPRGHFGKSSVTLCYLSFSPLRTNTFMARCPHFSWLRVFFSRAHVFHGHIFWYVFLPEHIFTSPLESCGTKIAASLGVILTGVFCTYLYELTYFYLCTLL